MRRVFNMGLGMLVAVRAEDAQRVVEVSGTIGVVGEICERGEDAVEFIS